MEAYLVCSFHTAKPSITSYSMAGPNLLLLKDCIQQ
jgi:hypothetical protein